MKYKLIAYLFLFNLVLSTTGFCASSDGGIPGNVLLWGTGARAIGMGRMYLSVADDGTTSYWNAAAMSQVKRKVFTTMYANLLGLDSQWNSQYAYLGVAWPTIGNETWGGSFVQLTSGQFQRTDKSAKVLGTFDVGYRAFMLAYARQLSESLTLGLSTAMLSNNVDTQSSSLITGDLSAFYKMDGIRAAGIIKNILAYSLGNKSKDVYPLTLKFGVSSMMLDDTFLLGVDMIRTEGADLAWAVGGEYNLWKNYFLRAGYNSGDLYGGVGLKLFGLKCDFAVHMAEVDLSYFFSMNYEFGNSRVEERESIISKNISEMKASIESGDFLKATEKGNAVLSLDASNLSIKKDLTMIAVLNEINSQYAKTQVYSTPKIKEFILLASQDYIRGANEKAANKLKYVIYLQPLDNPVAVALLKKIVVSGDESLLAGQDIVGEKLKESLVNFYGAKYRQVIENCDEIIQLESENVDAYLRKGSAYFMLMQEEDAITAWQKVLEIDPAKKSEIEQVIQKLRETRDSQPDGSENSTLGAPSQELKSTVALSLGTYATEKKAQKVVNKLRDLGITAAIEKSDNSNFRIVVRDPGKSADELKDMADKLKGLGYKTFWIK